MRKNIHYTKYQHVQSCDGVRFGCRKCGKLVENTQNTSMLKVVMGLEFVAGKCEKIETTLNTSMFKVAMGSDLVAENAGN